jgi:hypothetical protein
MGNYFASDPIVKFNERFYSQQKYPSFVITIYVHGMSYLDETDTHTILKFLSNTHPVIAYGYAQSYYLMYDSAIKEPSLRSNSFSDIISYMSSELTLFLVKNVESKKEPRFLDVRIESGVPSALMSNIKNIIKSNKYKGEIYGLENLNEEKIKEI